MTRRNIRHLIGVRYLIMKKNFRNLFLRKLPLLVLIYFSLASLKCKKDYPTQPPPLPTNCEYAAGNRNFTWRLDTVAWFPSTIGGVWAFSDTDAYVMGYIDGKPPYILRAGRHWNGKIWEDNIYGSYGFYGDISIDPRNDIIGDADL